MRRPRILDLYCGQGGASVGYYLAGFDVIGVDTKPQAQYPFPIIHRDSLACLQDDQLLSEIDAIHASPPRRFITRKQYHDLRSPTLNLLNALIDIPRVVEDVEATIKMPGSAVLCGTHFRLEASGRPLRRHCRFATSFPLSDPGPCSCQGKPVGGLYSGPCKMSMLRHKFDLDEARTAMGIDWMSRKGLALAIPPDYTRWVGEQLMRRYWPHVPARDHHRARYSSGRIERFAKL